MDYRVGLISMDEDILLFGVWIGKDLPTVAPVEHHVRLDLATHTYTVVHNPSGVSGGMLIHAAEMSHDLEMDW